MKHHYHHFRSSVKECLQGTLIYKGYVKLRVLGRLITDAAYRKWFFHHAYDHNKAVFPVKLNRIRHSVSTSVPCLHPVLYPRQAYNSAIYKIKVFIRKYPTLYFYCLRIKDLIGKKSLVARSLNMRLRGSFGTSSLTPLQVLNHQMRLLYQETILLCIRENVHGWWIFNNIFYASSPNVLRQVLREYVFRRAGNYKSYLTLSRRLTAVMHDATGYDTFLDELAEHYLAEMNRINSHAMFAGVEIASGKKPLLLALSVWGGHYIEMFLNYCLPSLMTEGNIGALCRHRQPVLLIHTNAAGIAQIEVSPAIRRLRELGVVLVYMRLNDALLARVCEMDNNKYWHLGMMQSLHLYAAQALQADYHILMPDHLYSSHYFEALLLRADAGHPVILQTSIRSEAEAVVKDIVPYTSADNISVAAADLIAIGLNHIHPLSRQLIMNRRLSSGELPPLHVMYWEGENSFHILSPHQTIAYLDSSVIADIPQRFFFTLDSEIDKVIPKDCPIYCPRAEDGLVFVEISPAEMFDSPPSTPDKSQYCEMFWRNVESENHLRFFGQDIVFPLNRKLRNEQGFASQSEIIQSQTMLRNTVRNGLPSCSAELILNGLQSVCLAEFHPAAQGMFSQLRDTAMKIWENYNKSPADAVDDRPYLNQIARILWHFDIMDESVECLRTVDPESDLASFIEICVERNRMNEEWGRDLLIKSGDMTRNSMVIGITVWGDSYVDFCMRYQVGCLLAEGNLPYLSQQGCVIVSFATDEAGKQRIEAHPQFQALLNLALVRFTVFEDAPSRRTPELSDQFYKRYGMIDHHHVFLAQAVKGCLFFMPPDCVFDNHAFYTLYNYLASGYDLCTAGALESFAAPLKDYLEKHIDVTGKIDLPAEDLMNTGVLHKSHIFRSLIFDPKNIPNFHPRELVWKVPGGYVTHSLFMHPFAISARVLSRPFHANHENVDWALIPRLLQADGTVKLIDDATEFVLIHADNAAVKYNSETPFKYGISRNLLDHFLLVHSHDYPIHRQFFAVPKFFPCKDSEYSTSPTYLTDIAVLKDVFCQFSNTPINNLASSL